MMIIGCDFHPSFQEVAYVEQETGEYEERRLTDRREAEAFYRSLAGRAVHRDRSNGERSLVPQADERTWS